MAYKIYKMVFTSAHFGDNSLDLSSLAFSADRLFSALVLEAIKAGQLEDFLTLAQADDFVLTDAFPFDSIPYLPKPIGYPTIDNIKQVDDVVKMRQEAKRSKKLQYIAYTELGRFLEGQIFDNHEFAKHHYVTKNQPDKEGTLYQVGAMTFHERSALYVIANQSNLLDYLMNSLQYSGLGGKRTSGHGQFQLTILNVPKDLKERLTRDSSSPVMTLTTSLPIESDLEQAMDDSHYLLKKASGFAFSEEHRENLRKQDLYKFKSGSTFAQSFTGDIFDVRPDEFPHPVWNYAKPLFYRLEV